MAGHDAVKRREELVENFSAFLDATCSVTSNLNEILRHPGLDVAIEFSYCPLESRLCRAFVELQRSSLGLQNAGPIEQFFVQTVNHLTNCPLRAAVVHTFPPRLWWIPTCSDYHQQHYL